jgi:hypothetical protein
VALPDTHIPFHIDLHPIFRFIEDFKPDKIVILGDAHDWTSVCHWIADQSRHLDGGILKDNYRELHTALLDPLNKIRGKAEIIYILGNHEDWLIRASFLDPNGRGYWELEKNIDLKKYNMQIVQVNKSYRVNDNLSLIHGTYCNLYHARKHAEVYHQSVLYGHVHDIQSHVLVSPIDVDKFYKGASIGCLCNLNPHYMRNRPNRWVNGFNYIYADEKDGSFQDFQVVIVKNKFWANGKKYS